MIICVGEILLDCYINSVNEEIKITAYPGGAPYNVSCNLNYLGNDVSFVGSVGKDEFGNELINHVQKQAFKYPQISQQKNYNTTLALVKLNKNNDRSFSFIRTNGADYHLRPIPLSLIKKANIIHFGSLMLSTKVGRSYMQKQLKVLKSFNLFITFDVNYRQELFNNKEEAKKYYFDVLPSFNLVKLSSDEVYFLTNKINEDEGIKLLLKPNQIYIVTLGSKGSKLYFEDKIIFVPSTTIKTIDTTGAGDAFLSGILNYINKYPFTKSELYLTNLLKYANKLGAFATTHIGAISKNISTYKL